MVSRMPWCLGLLFYAQAAIAATVGPTSVTGNTVEASNSSVVRHTRPSAGPPQIMQYFWDLLDMALKATQDVYGPSHTKPDGAVSNHPRAMQRLLSGEVDVHVRGIMPEQYKDTTLVVPVPLDKGLSGYRVMLLHKDTQEPLGAVKSLADLRRFRLGVVTGWVSRVLFEANALNTVPVSSYRGVFYMLDAKRVDLFARSVVMVADELAFAKQQGLSSLVADDTLLLHYPFSFFFVVANNDKGRNLHQRLSLGLQRLKDSGAFERRYQTMFAKVLRDVRLDGRRVIELRNQAYEQGGYGTDDVRNWEALTERSAP